MDTDALARIEAIEAEIGYTMADQFRNAINALVVGMKATPSPKAGVSNWDAITSMRLFAGIPKLGGALVPLKGNAGSPTNFVEKDLSIWTGLKGNGTTKYIDTGYSHESFEQDNFSIFLWISEQPSGNIRTYMGAGSDIGESGGTSVQRSASVNTVQFRVQSSATIAGTYTYSVPGFFAASREASNLTKRITPTSLDQSTTASQPPAAGNIYVFGLNATAYLADARIGLYGFGEAIDVSAMKTLVDSYMQTVNTNPGSPTSRGFPMSRMVN